jgi:hypothetical protein
VLHFDLFGAYVKDADAYRDRLAKRRGHGASDVGSCLYLVWRPKSQTIGSVRSPGRGESSQLGQPPSRVSREGWALCLDGGARDHRGARYALDARPLNRYLLKRNACIAHAIAFILALTRRQELLTQKILLFCEAPRVTCECV